MLMAEAKKDDSLTYVDNIALVVRSTEKVTTIKFLQVNINIIWSICFIIIIIYYSSSALHP